MSVFSGPNSSHIISSSKYTETCAVFAQGLPDVAIQKSPLIHRLTFQDFIINGQLKSKNIKWENSELSNKL
jgi:hypothetical protein